jgi:hypothetical protein
VTGNFKVTSTVRARKSSTPADPPSERIHLGGLMARDAASDGPAGESYVFIVVGQDENDLSVETKTTTGDVSTYTGPPWPSGDAELRVCRVGSQFLLYKRAIGELTWTEAAHFDRPDLPATLQVGPNVYSAAATPDLQVAFDGVVFAEVADAAACAQD